MKKFNFFATILTLILASLLLFGCVPTEEGPTTYKAVFKINGVTVATETFTADNLTVTEPVCQEEGYLYIWEKYSLSTNNIIIGGIKVEMHDYTSLKDDLFLYHGRNVYDDNYVKFFNADSGFEVSFYGTEISASIGVDLQGSTQPVTLNGEEICGKVRVYVDGDKEGKVFNLHRSTNKIVLCSELNNGLHHVKVSKCNSDQYNTMTFYEVADYVTLAVQSAKQYKFEFYGDSLTSGFDVLSTGVDNIGSEDATLSYASFVANYFDAQNSTVSQSGIAMAVDCYGHSVVACDVYGNYCLSYNKYLGKWDFSQYQADVIVINLGTNDGSKFYQLTNAGNNTEYAKAKRDFIAGYTKMLQGLREVNPNAVIICTYGETPQLNSDIIEGIKKAVSNVNDSKIFYFQFSPVICGSSGHPTQIGHKTASEQLIDYIENYILKLL